MSSSDDTEKPEPAAQRAEKSMIGVDIVELTRFKKAVCGKNGARLLRRVFTDAEIGQCELKGNLGTLQAFAGRFAAKEAVIKASKGALSLADLRNIEVLQDSRGVLDVFIAGKDRNWPRFEVSISHDGDYAVGMAMRVSE